MVNYLDSACIFHDNMCILKILKNIFVCGDWRSVWCVGEVHQHLPATPLAKARTTDKAALNQGLSAPFEQAQSIQLTISSVECVCPLQIHILNIKAASFIRMVAIYWLCSHSVLGLYLGTVHQNPECI